MYIKIEVEPYEHEFMATCKSFPGLSTFGDTPLNALYEFSVVLQGALEIYEEDGLKINFEKR